MQKITPFMVRRSGRESRELLYRDWGKLSAGGGRESGCSWLKDKFSVSWQTTPTVLIDMLHEKDPEKAERLMQAMLQMEKIEIEKLKAACDRK